MAEKEKTTRLPRYLKEEKPIELDVYGVIDDTLDYLYGEFFKTRSGKIWKQIEALERVKDELEETA